MARVLYIAMIGFVGGVLTDLLLKYLSFKKGE